MGEHFNKSNGLENKNILRLATQITFQGQNALFHNQHMQIRSLFFQHTTVYLCLSSENTYFFLCLLNIFWHLVNKIGIYIGKRWDLRCALALNKY